MDNTFNTDIAAVAFDEVIEKTFDAAGKVIENALDVSTEMDKVITMTPKDGYQKKLELISSAEDMSTKEKIKAIDDAEDKYASDLAQNSEMCKGMMWAKAGLIISCTAGVVLMVASPEGRKIAKSILKAVA